MPDPARERVVSLVRRLWASVDFLLAAFKIADEFELTVSEITVTDMPADLRIQAMQGFMIPTGCGVRIHPTMIRPMIQTPTSRPAWPTR